MHILNGDIPGESNQILVQKRSHIIVVGMVSRHVPVPVVLLGIPCMHCNKTGHM